MDFRFAIEGGSGAQVSAARADGGSAAKLAPAVSVPVCRKRRLEITDPPGHSEKSGQSGTAIIGVPGFLLGNQHLKIDNEPAVEMGFQCAGCGEWNQTVVDESAGRVQSYVEDCQVCCKPNLLRVQYDTQEQDFVITAQLE